MKTVVHHEAGRGFDALAESPEVAVEPIAPLGRAVPGLGYDLLDPPRAEVVRALLAEL